MIAGGINDEPCLSISVIIPALNEENYVGATLESIELARRELGRHRSCSVEVIVVNNGSTDRTTDVARDHGAEVVDEPVRNIARARNRGAAAARGNLLVFVDADVVVPRLLLKRLAEVLDNPDCIGGAVHSVYRPVRPVIRMYVRFRRSMARLMKLAQGATQFCRRNVFEEIGGYDEGLYVGEDVDFYRNLRRLARSRGQRLEFLTDIRVAPSTRRHDKWAPWRIVVFTSAAASALLGRREKAWAGWYRDAPR